jgi:hypothetical protein
MDNIRSTIRNTRRLTCAWVPTGNSKMPLVCVWTEAQPSRADCTDQLSPNVEVEGIRFVRLGEVAFARPNTERVQIRHSGQRHLLTFLIVFGPRLIAMETHKGAGETGALCPETPCLN